MDSSHLKCELVAGLTSPRQFNKIGDLYVQLLREYSVHSRNLKAGAHRAPT